MPKSSVHIHWISVSYYEKSVKNRKEVIYLLLKLHNVCDREIMVFSVPALALISIIFVNFMAQKYRQMKQIYGPLRKQQKIHEIFNSH